MTDWEMLGALGNWFMGGAMILTILVTIWHFNTQHERKIRILLKISGLFVEVKILNEGNRSLRIDSFGFFRGGKYIALPQSESYLTTTSDNPLIIEISKKTYEERLAEAMENEALGYEHTVKIFVDGGGAVYFSKTQFEGDLRLSKNNEEKIKLKRWRFEPQSAVKFIHSTFSFFSMLATFFIAFMTFIFEMQNDFFVALLYSIAVAGIGAYIYLTVERYFENKLEKWTKEESNKNRKRAKIDAIIIFLSTVALFIILKRIDLIIIYPVFFILFIEVAYKNAGNRWND